MKKFTDNINEKTNHYAGDQKIFNEIFDLIEEHLTPKMDGEDSDKVSFVGQDDLVKELSKLVENQIIKSKIKVLESYKNTPDMITERVEEKDELGSLILETQKSDWKKMVSDDYHKIVKTIKSCKTDKQFDAAEKLIENFFKKCDNVSDGTVTSVVFLRAPKLL